MPAAGPLSQSFFVELEDLEVEFSSGRHVHTHKAGGDTVRAQKLNPSRVRHYAEDGLTVEELEHVKSACIANHSPLLIHEPNQLGISRGVEGHVGMPVYFGLYRINANLPPPPSPTDQIKQLEAFQAALKMQMESGDLKEVHEFIDANAGYFVSGDISPERMHQNLTAWFPYVTFEVHQTVPTQKAIQNALAAAKMRAGMR